jgi:hypothetical protein
LSSPTQVSGPIRFQSCRLTQAEAAIGMILKRLKKTTAGRMKSIPQGA